MPKVKTGGTATKTPARKPAAAAKPKASTGPSQTGEAKRIAQEKQDTALRAQVVKRCVKGNETVGAVAKELKITPGKAAFLIMQHRVEVSEVPTIEAKTEAGLVTAIANARAKADEFSSWGWLAARSGKSEGFIKSRLEEAGKYTPKAENIAVKRSGSKPAAAKSTPTRKASTGKKTVRGNS